MPICLKMLKGTMLRLKHPALQQVVEVDGLLPKLRTKQDDWHWMRDFPWLHQTCSQQPSYHQSPAKLCLFKSQGSCTQTELTSPSMKIVVLSFLIPSSRKADQLINYHETLQWICLSKLTRPIAHSQTAKQLGLQKDQHLKELIQRTKAWLWKPNLGVQDWGEHCMGQTMGL